MEFIVKNIDFSVLISVEIFETVLILIYLSMNTQILAALSCRHSVSCLLTFCYCYFHF